VTYFDGFYAAQGIVMLRSLRKHDPSAEATVLCFDDVASASVRRLGDARVSTVTPDDLLAFEPRLAACRDRSLGAYYATHKPVLPAYVLTRRPDTGSIMHIDADMMFFASPKPLFAEIADASVAVSPHRFSAAYDFDVVFGTFNAGLIYWKNDSVGRLCLAEYREDCLAWCAPEVLPDGRFMNQGYLTRWPARYDDVHVIKHPGVNYATWNFANKPVRRGRRIRIGRKRLILFHATMTTADAKGLWWVNLKRPETVRSLPAIITDVLGRYVRAVRRAEREFGLRPRLGLRIPDETDREWIRIGRGRWPDDWPSRIKRALWSASQIARRGRLPP
jgi:hypothetical protein